VVLLGDWVGLDLESVAGLRRKRDERLQLTRLERIKRQRATETRDLERRRRRVEREREELMGEEKKVESGDRTPCPFYRSFFNRAKFQTFHF